MPALPHRFCLVLVKPSHYDDDGYVIQWLRSPIPSNSLASLYGLAKDCAERRVLGDMIDIHAFDETNTRIRPERFAAMIEAAGRRHGDAGRRPVEPVAACARHRAAAARAWHPSRYRRLPRLRHDQHAQGCRRRPRPGRQMGLSLFAGEAEGRLDDVLLDAAAGTLKPLYNYMDDLPGIEGTPIPLMAAERVQRPPAA